jgi:hypothetical protein
LNVLVLFCCIATSSSLVQIFQMRLSLWHIRRFDISFNIQFYCATFVYRRVVCFNCFILSNWT